MTTQKGPARRPVTMIPDELRKLIERHAELIKLTTEDPTETDTESDPEEGAA